MRFIAGCIALSIALHLTNPGQAGSQVPATRAGYASLSGRVVDTAGHPIDGVEIALTDLRRRVLSTSTGSFRLDSVPRGQWVVRARKIGYAAETRTVDVDSASAPIEFRLASTVRTLVPIVTAASRVGLSGVVNDGAGKPIPKARVRVLGTGLEAMTDSAGAFWLPAPAGSHMVAVARQSFAERIAGVRIPPDSGRQITVWLRPATSVPTREVWNIEDLRERLAWTRRSRQTVFTRDELEQDGYEWVYDVVQATWQRLGRKAFVSPECALVVNGGPGIVSLARLLVDDIESIEIYPRFPRTSATVAAAAPRAGRVQGGQFVQLSNTRAAEMANGALPCLAVYVWLR